MHRNVLCIDFVIAIQGLKNLTHVKWILLCREDRFLFFLLYMMMLLLLICNEMWVVHLLFLLGSLRFNLGVDKIPQLMLELLDINLLLDLKQIHLDLVSFIRRGSSRCRTEALKQACSGHCKVLLVSNSDYIMVDIQVVEASSEAPRELGILEANLWMIITEIVMLSHVIICAPAAI